MNLLWREWRTLAGDWQLFDSRISFSSVRLSSHNATGLSLAKYGCQPVIARRIDNGDRGGGGVCNTYLKTTQTSPARMKHKKIKQNQIQYFQQQHAAHDRHLFLDKDSRSLIEHFSRLRHLVSERSVLTQSKNLNLELVCSTFFRRKPCDSPSSDSRFDSHCFFSFLFFVSFGSCDRSTSFTVRTQQENWKIANQQRIVYTLHSSVIRVRII